MIFSWGVEEEFEEGIESSGLLMHGNLHSEAAFYGEAEECAQRCPYHAHLGGEFTIFLSRIRGCDLDLGI